MRALALLRERHGRAGKRVPRSWGINVPRLGAGDQRAGCLGDASPSFWEAFYPVREQRHVRTHPPLCLTCLASTLQIFSPLSHWFPRQERRAHGWVLLQKDRRNLLRSWSAGLCPQRRTPAALPLTPPTSKCASTRSCR